MLWQLCSRLCAWNGLPLNTYISMYSRTNWCYNERGSRTSYVRSSVPHCILRCCALSTGSHRRFGNRRYFVFVFQQSNKNLLRLSTLNETWITTVTTWDGTTSQKTSNLIIHADRSSCLSNKSSSLHNNETYWLHVAVFTAALRPLYVTVLQRRSKADWCDTLPM